MESSNTNYKVKKSTIIRTICMVLALVNQFLTATGHSVLPFDSETVCESVSTVITAVISVWAWWKNNSFTKNALNADVYLNELKTMNKDK